MDFYRIGYVTPIFWVHVGPQGSGSCSHSGSPFAGPLREELFMMRATESGDPVVEIFYRSRMQSSHLSVGGHNELCVPDDRPHKCAFLPCP